MIILPAHLPKSFEDMKQWYAEVHKSHQKELEGGILCSTKQLEEYRDLFPEYVFVLDVLVESLYRGGMLSFRGHPITDNEELLS